MSFAVLRRRRALRIFFYFVALPEVGVDYEFVDAGVLMDVVVYVAADGVSVWSRRSGREMPCISSGIQ